MNIIKRAIQYQQKKQNNYSSILQINKFVLIFQCPYQFFTISIESGEIGKDKAQGGGAGSGAPATTAVVASDIGVL